MTVFKVDVWDSPELNGRILRLSDGRRYVQHLMTEEEIVQAVSARALIHAKLEILCEKWNEQHGGRTLKVRPPNEGEEWGVHEDDVIDGEIVEERRAIDASRAAIEGR